MKLGNLHVRSFCEHDSGVVLYSQTALREYTVRNMTTLKWGLLVVGLAFAGGAFRLPELSRQIATESRKSQGPGVRCRRVGKFEAQQWLPDRRLGAYGQARCCRFHLCVQARSLGERIEVTGHYKEAR